MAAIARSSVILICTEADTQVYQSMDDLPPKVRRKIEETTGGSNSGTILIADKRGMEELLRALDGAPSRIQCRAADRYWSRKRSYESQPELPRLQKRPTWSVRVRSSLEFLIPALVVVSLWWLLNVDL